MIRPALCLFVALVALWAPSAASAQARDLRTEALIGLARVKRDAGDLAAARSYFEEASRLRGLSLDERTEYFWVLAEQDARAAVDVGRSILREKPDQDEVRDRAIAAASHTGDESAVVSLASEARRLAPRAPRWARLLGDSYLRTGQPRLAVDAYRAAAGASEGAPEDLIALAVALEAAGEHAEAASTWFAVPVDVVAQRPEWRRGRLRALTIGASASAAERETVPWLREHPEDEEIRVLLAEAWAREDRPADALRVLRPLTSGRERHRWARREAELARAAGDRDRSINALDVLVSRGDATVGDRRTLAELLVERGDSPRAARLLLEVSRNTPGCDDQLLALADRLQDDVGTGLLLEMVRDSRCEVSPRWTDRAIARAVAAGRHRDALALVRTLPPSLLQATDARRLEGQLLLWTGAPAAAAAVLHPLVDDHPEMTGARESLVDAYRATRQPYAAWAVAEPLLKVPSLSDERIVMLAELSLEADRPDVVEPLVGRIRGGARAKAGVELSGRALLALGRPHAAARLLRGMSPSDLSPAGALALIDSVVSINGHRAALGVARCFGLETEPWADVLVRRIVIETLAGEAGRATALRRSLQRLDAELATVADAEVALAAGRPLDALKVLASIEASHYRDRVNDLRSVALVEAGRLAEAQQTLRTLSTGRPHFTAFAVREAVLAWRVNPSPEARDDLLRLAQRVAGHREAEASIAQALLSSGRYADTLAVLADGRQQGDLPLQGIVAAAIALRAEGQASDALALLSGHDELHESAAILRAQLAAAVKGPHAAQEEFSMLAARADATAAAFDAWAAVLTDRAQQIQVLERAIERFPDRAGLLTGLASAYVATRQFELAVVPAMRATTLDPAAASAWFALVSATAAARPGEVTAVLDRFRQAASCEPSVVIGMAEHVAGLIRAPDDPLAERVLEMLQEVAGDASVLFARELARARVFAAVERWPDAVLAVDAALSHDPRSLAAHRLRADVLSWAGRHSDGLAAYQAYLMLAPDDLAAQRQRARVTGWSGQYEEARSHYAQLVKAFPDHPAIAAEASAKQAFFAGRWRSAARRYEAWLALEPGNTEAQFELAESLRAAGHIDGADSALEALEAQSGHRLAAAARARAAFSRQPSFSVLSEHRSAEGYAGGRLLDLHHDGASLTLALGRSGGTVVGLEAGRAKASSDAYVRDGHRGSLQFRSRLSPRLEVAGASEVWLWPNRSATAAGHFRAVWQPGDVWTFAGGADREPLFENMRTLDEGITATGFSAVVARSSRAASFELRTAWQQLSDGNARFRVTLTLDRTVHARLRRLRVLARAEELAYSRPAAPYFSPSHFLRFDGGFEYLQPFSQVRFNGDRRAELAVGYLLGGDNRAQLYQQPYARLTWELFSSVAVDARARWAHSQPYRDSSFSLRLRVGGGAGAW